ncbi:putative MATE family efflux protein [Mobilisporobacter senegalensis]|uniref:Putative MATE family efflux protein n=1 Tax=Mobilisporobacter senegalensis TaxID=1329262 RepID=A0A3N1Y2L5_9FIRM|nr:MATE family efflux transporter [Mobilisporobacter senegalensis]ROR31782.1 putative MATE family efflux protein [Mobilisporobacter senegalensis]
MDHVMEDVIIENNKITEGVIWKQLLIFFFPLLFGSFFQQLYNTADAIVVGRFVGKEALSAVGGTTGTLINVCVGFFVGISAGATVTISQYYGGKQKEEVSKAVHTAIAFSLIGGIIIMFIGIIGAPYALKWMGTPDDIMSDSLMYLRIYFGGMVANLTYNMGAGILRAIGDSKRPLYFLIISCFINIVLDVLFVVVFGWDVAGAAIATVVSQICSALFVWITLMRTNESYKLHIRSIRIHKEMLKKTIKLGLPAGFQSLMYTTSNVIIQSTMNGFGTDTIAAWTAYGKVDGIFWMTMSSFGISMTTFAGQNFGAGKYDRVRKGAKVCLTMAMSTAICMSLFLFFGGTYIYQLFSTDKLVIAKGMEILHFMVPAFFTYVTIEILSGTLRGMGDSLIPMILTGMGICVLRIIWLFTVVPAWHDVKTVVFSYPFSWTITSILFILYYQYYLKRNQIT